MAKHIVKCLYCKKSFDTNLEPWVKPNATRYAHEVCHNKAMAEHSQDESDKEALINYIKELHGYEQLPPVVNKQIKQYIEEYKYSYSGILKALKYFYEVKHGDKEKANGRIGIVAYCYQDAHRYYYAIWEAQEKNRDKEVETFIPPTQEVHINPPKRIPMGIKKSLFSFLDEGAE